MLKFIKHHMSSITDIEVFPLIAFVLFLLIFIMASWLAITKRRSYIDHMAGLPLTADGVQDPIPAEQGPDVPASRSHGSH